MIKYTPYRWFILFLFGLGNAFTSIHWMLFAPIVNKILLAYPKATYDNINYMNMSYYIIMSIDNPLCAYISERWGLRVAVLLGCGLMLLGGFLKSFMNDQWMFVMVG